MLLTALCNALANCRIRYAKTLLIMKFTAIFLFAACLQVSANGYSQKITLSQTNVPLKKVLKEIANQSGYQFFYKDKLLRQTGAVTLSVNNASIEEVLDKCFRDQPLMYTIVDKIVVIKGKKPELKLQQPQLLQPPLPVPIKGLVKDDKGMLLAGVSVVVKGTQKGTTTNREGVFTIDATVGDVLEFSIIGYKKVNLTVGSNTNLFITMEVEASVGSDVVVVGYGTQRRSDLTGAVASADMQIFKESPHANILQSLHGSVPGLSVGAVKHSGESPSINIRGENNFSGDNAPLIVVDGIIYRGNLNDINPDDIKSVDILKGPSAAAVYGSQSSNGVILISTKNGGKDMKPVLSYSGYYSTQQPSHLVKPASPEENIRSIADSRWQTSRLAPDYIKPNPDFDPRSYFKTNHIVNGYNQFIKDGTYTDWWNLLTGSAYMTNHNLSLRGGSNDFNYYISGGYLDQNGYIYNDNYKRYSVRMNLSGDVTKWLNIGINSFASRSDYSGASVDQATLFSYSPFAFPYDPTGNLITRPDGNRLNPLLVSQIEDQDIEGHLFANVYVNVKPSFIKGFNYRLNFGNDYQSNQHYQFDPWASDGLGRGYKNYANYYDLTVDNIFNYKKAFNKDNELDATFVYGIEKRKADNTNASATDFDNMRLGYNSLQLGNASLNTISTDAWLETSLYTMGRAVYTFKGKYIFTGTIRRDGFSGFGKDTKFGIFPSAAVGWVMSKEKPIQDKASWISFLKLRGSYGTTGRRSLSRYQTLAKVSTDYSYVAAGSPVIGQWVSSLSNPSLKWETTTGINVGIDYSFFNSRLNGSIDYYNSKTKNILYEVPLPQISGFSSVPINVGKVRNHGLEWVINGVVVRNKHLTWNVGLNFSMNRNRIISIIGADNDQDGIEDDLISANLFIGQPIGVIYGYVNAGMWQMADEKAGSIPNGFFSGTYKVKDLDGDGVITANDRKVLGYGDPAFRMGFMSTLSYNRFTFKLFVNTIQGGSRYYFSTSDDPGGGSGDNWDNQNKPQLWDYWLPDNPGATYRRLDLTSSYQQPQLTQRSFIRLQNLSASYKLNTDVLNKISMRHMEIYLSGENLLTWAPYWKGWDPETGEGYNRSGTPVLRSVTMGVNIEF